MLKLVYCTPVYLVVLIYTSYHTAVVVHLEYTCCCRHYILYYEVQQK